ncbi:MAG TPA: GNAT family N-acetyltransferase [Clostridiales bacterium]|nr:GNAT family N-acetyltransferase [Clostridiales bacterium]HQP69862.1 GNAT family N-acetyltransferase [Clostridiales bacterium]
MASKIITLHDKAEIFSYLNRNPALHVYSIGDLDDFYFPHTIWYAKIADGSISALILNYIGMNPPTIISFTDTDRDETIALIEGIKPLLPKEFNAHFSPGLIDVIGKDKICKEYGLHYRMVLKKAPNEINNPGFQVRIVTKTDLSEITTFYEINYPDNWFDPRMLETGKFYGCFDKSVLVGIAGIHVYSPQYKVAAVGSISTAITHRGRSICKILTSTLCKDLLKTVDVLGLNVKASNAPAVRAYKAVGFEIYSEYEEYLIKL